MTTPQKAKEPRAMTAGATSKPVEPRTLAEAHEALASVRPPRTAPLSEWLAYHQRAAAVYAEIAEIDRGHHHEALFMAEQERQHAKETKIQVSAERRLVGKERMGNHGDENREAGSTKDVDAGS